LALSGNARVPEAIVMKTQNTLTIETATVVEPAGACEAVAVCVFAGEPAPMLDEGAGLAAVERIIGDGEFEGKAETSLFVHVAGGAKGSNRRLLLLGLGERDADEREALRRAAGRAVREAGAGGVKHLQFILPSTDGDDVERQAAAIAEGALLGSYENGFYQHQDEEETRLERLTIVARNESERLSAAIERARIIAEAVNWARRLADEPGAHLPPREFARRAAQMAEEFGLRVESLDAGQIRELGMGALLGVAQGSDEPPALIVIRYEPEEAAPSDELWAFVGKGITFDTGGISLKHGLDMWEMKSDMAGGAAVLGALRAIAQLKPRRRIVGIVPAAENMPSGSAIKPGDIVRTLAGHTIEVVDTDAEGRLVLVDGIAYAKQLGATRIVDLATLTGSIIIALGDYRTGLFSNDDDWANRVLAAAESAGEPTWRMPVSDDYKKRIESPIADFKNYGGRPDATAAALLLSKFAARTPWVHLDIAGTAWYDGPRPHAPEGSTGAGVRTLVELACRKAQAS
jgi:leucyl aminopeptidase